MSLIMRCFLLLALMSFVDMSLAEKRLYARKTIGEIHEIDLAERKAVISGYRYDFGSVVIGNDSEVKMLGGSTGAFEMLEPGMKVFLLFADTGVSRYVLRAEQIPYGTDIHDFDVRKQYIRSQD